VNDLIVRARRLLRDIGQRMTFLSDLAHRAALVLDPSLDAVAIDVANVRIAMNPSWCESLTDRELSFVLVHELFHALLRTGPRGEGADAIHWNFAHDLVINQRVSELLEMQPPRGGVTLDADDRVSAETAYLRARNGQYKDQLREWASTKWQVDAHPDSSVALANSRAGHAGSSMDSGRGVMTYVAVDHDECAAAGERAALIESTHLHRPWPRVWLDQLRGTGSTRGRSWSRPSRRANEGGVLSAGRHRTLPDRVDVLFDVTPSMLAHAARLVGHLRAFALDNGLTRIRLVSVDETGVVADEEIDPATWSAVRLPRALVIQRSSDSRFVDGTWVCKSCSRPHASKRPCSLPPAFNRVDRTLRATAIVIAAKRS
jgi:hypothetical protein